MLMNNRVGLDKNLHARLYDCFKRVPVRRIEIFSVHTQAVEYVPHPCVNLIARIQGPTSILGISFWRIEGYFLRIPF